jgi:sugar phosphate isomerase/epimerase
MSNRRDFLLKSLAGAAAVAIPTAFVNEASAQTSSWNPSSFKIGHQLWNVRDMLEKDADSTMKLMARLGFEGVEYSGMTGPTFPTGIEYRLLQNKYNLACCGIHHGLTEWLQRGHIPLMEYSYILGNPDLSCHWLDPPQSGTLENYLSHAKFFSELMAILKSNGFNFYYHNHAFEFTEVFNGKYAMDIMLENTDPALFFMELHIGGLPESVNTVQYIKMLGARLYKMHFPVIDRDGNVTIKQDIIDAAMESGSCKWFIIEQGIPDLPTGDSLARSVNILREMLYK